MLRVRAEELEDRVEPVLATAISRPRYVASQVALVFALPAAGVGLAGAIVGIFGTSADVGVCFGATFLQALAAVADASPDWWGLVWISLVTLFFLVAGYVGLRHRDLAR